MKQISLNRRLPYGPGDIYDLIMDIRAYPQIYPSVKAIKVLDNQPGHQDVEFSLNLPTPFKIGDPRQTVRITGLRPQAIDVKNVQGPFKTLDMRWELAPARDGGTDLCFTLSYESGKGTLADMVLSGAINSIANDTMRRFEVHAGQKLKPVQTPAAARRRFPKPDQGD